MPIVWNQAVGRRNRAVNLCLVLVLLSGDALERQAIGVDLALAGFLVLWTAWDTRAISGSANRLQGVIHARWFEQVRLGPLVGRGSGASAR